MIFEAQIVYSGKDAKGCEKTIKEEYLVDDLVLFHEVEEKLYEMFEGHNDLDVTKIKRSNLKEIANERPSNTYDEYKIYVITIADNYVMDNGDTKETKYNVAYFAKDSLDAYKFAERYIAQGLDDMELKQIKETKFIDVIK